MAAAYANLPAGVRADILRLSAVLPALLEKAGPSPAARQVRAATDVGVRRDGYKHTTRS